MDLTLHKLIEGDQDIVRYYQNAHSIWKNILKNFSVSQVQSIANDLRDRQLNHFEKECGGRDMGKEIMGVVGIMQFHSESTAFEKTRDDAEAVYQAIRESMCSVEVKHEAKMIAKMLYLIDDE